MVRPRSPNRADAPEIKEAVVDVRPGEPPEHLFRTLLGAYLGGADTFVIRGEPRLSPEAREVVKTFCRRTRQPEIVSEEPDVVRLRDLASEDSLPLPRSLARMGRLVIEFHRAAVGSWSRLTVTDDAHWCRRDEEIDREAWYIQRVAALRLRLPGEGSTALGLWTVARSLERVADHAVILGEEGQRLADLLNGGGPLTSLGQYHRQAMVHLEAALTAADRESANDVLDVGEALSSSGRALADRLLPAAGGGSMPPAAAAAVARVLESIGRTVAYAQDIAQVVLDRSVELPTASPARLRMPENLPGP
jgi:PhoU domain-containing protein